MAESTCKPCAAQLTLPCNVPADARRQAATLWRAGETAAALRLLSDQMKGDAARAAVMLFHLPRWRGWCHHCRQPVDALAEAVCAACGALNLAWQGDSDPSGPPLEGPGPVTDHPVAIDRCPSCSGEITHGTTRCWHKGCGFTLPEGFVAVAPEGGTLG